MPKFKSMKEANEYIMSQINDTLANEVFKVVQKAELKAIEDKVYSTYNPSTYIRRGADSGLSDPKNIVMENTPSDGTLVVVNITPANANRSSYRTNERKFKSIVKNAARKDLSEQVEYGHNNPWQYDFPSDGEYMKPRPFTDTTVKNLDSSKAHIEALKKELKQRGIQVAK